MPRRARTCWRWARWRSRARAPSFAGTRASASPTSGTSGTPARIHVDRVWAAGDERSRFGRDLREPRTRARLDLPDDERRQLCAGRDGDVHHLRGVDDDAPRPFLLAGIRPDAADRIRRRGHRRACAHPSGRTAPGDCDRDPDDRAVHRDQRARRLGLRARGQGLRQPVSGPVGPARKRFDLRPGHRHLRRLPRHRRRSLALLPPHDAGARDAGGCVQSRREPADGSAGRLDARPRLGLRGRPRGDRGDDGRADGLSGSGHDARRPDLRVRRCRTRRNRQPGGRGRRRSPDRRRDQSAGRLRQLRGAGAQAADGARRAVDCPRDQAVGPLRSCRGAEGLMRRWTTPVLQGLVLAGGIGCLFGIPARRLAGVSLALATLAVAVSLPAIAKRFEHLTGGGGGLSLPLPHAPFGWHVSTPHWLYYEAWVCAGILFVVAWLLVRGRVGRAWRAIRDGEIAAVSSGVSPAVYKTLAFGISAAYAGVAGALFAIQVSYINPDTFPVTLSLLLLASVIIGGLASLSGVIVGALVLEFLPIYAQAPPVLHLHFAKQAGPVVFGVALMVIVLLIPGGAASVVRRITRPVTAALARRS